MANQPRREIPEHLFHEPIEEEPAEPRGSKKPKPTRRAFLLGALAGIGSAVGASKLAKYFDSQPVAKIPLNKAPERRSALHSANATPLPVQRPTQAATSAPEKTLAGPNRASTELEQQLQAKIAELKAKGTLGEKDQVSLVVYGLQSHRDYARINDEVQNVAASLIKPFAMLAGYHKVNQGTPMTEELRKHMVGMIAASENHDANEVIRFAGGVDAVDKIARDYGFQHTRVVEEIPTDAKHEGQAYQNTTSAHDLNELLASLHRRELISPWYSDQMMHHLDTYETRKGKYPGSRVREFARDHHLQLAGKTGFVNGINGEATRVTFKKAGGQFAYNFVIMVTNPEMQTAGEQPGKEWGRRTTEAIRTLFQTAHEHVESQVKTSKLPAVKKPPAPARPTTKRRR